MTSATRSPLPTPRPASAAEQRSTSAQERRVGDLPAEPRERRRLRMRSRRRLEHPEHRQVRVRLQRVGDAGRVGREPGPVVGHRGHHSRRASTRSTTLLGTFLGTLLGTLLVEGPEPADRLPPHGRSARRVPGRRTHGPPAGGGRAGGRGAPRTGRGPAGRVGDPLPVRRVAGRPVVRAGVRAGVGAAVPDRARAARGGRAPLGMVLGPHDRVRPVRADGRVPPDRGARGAALERGIAVDDAAVRRRGPGLDGGDAGPAARVRDARGGPGAPRGSRGLGGGVRLPRVGPLGQLGRRAAPAPPVRAVRSRDRGGPPAAAGRRPARARGGLARGAVVGRAPPFARPGLEQLGRLGFEDGERTPAAGQRSAPARAATGGVVRAPPAGARVRGPRGGAARSSPASWRGRRRTTRGA